MDKLEIIGACVGLVYLWLELRASIYLWIAGVVMPFIYLFVYFNAGLYADVGINIYYLLAALYGWIKWMKRKGFSSVSASAGTEEKPLLITHTPPHLWWRLAAIAAILFAAIASILIFFTDSTVPYANSFITSLSIIGLWQLAHKHVEMWLTWIVVDVVCCVLYYHKELPYTSALYGIYTVVAVYGYFKWKRLMIEQRA